jgi:peptidoglycan/LPS O-acetylase OafA/YrhL
VRGVAILAVIVAHYRPRAVGADVEAYFWAIPYFGWLGVDLFFALSGFLITGILMDTKGSPGWLFRFYARRTLRIFPLYFAFLAFLFLALVPLVASTFPEQAAAVRGNAVWYWTYTVNLLVAWQGEGAAPLKTLHLWSLAVEEQFYLLWPWAVLALSRERLIVLCGGLLVLAIALRLLPLPMEEPGYFTFVRLDGIVTGSLLALSVRGPQGWRVLPRPPAIRRALVVALPVMLLTLLAGSAMPGALQPIMPTARALVFAGAVAYAATAPSRLLGSRPLRALGRYSYGLYVVHFPLLLLLELAGVRGWMSGSLTGDLAFVGVGLACSLAVAVPSWYLFEQPILRLKRYVEYGAGASVRTRSESVPA